MEAQRNGEQMSFLLWEPFVWEYSSAISSLLLFPFIVKLLNKVPLSWQRLKQTLFVYFGAATLFSVLHVGLMVGMRKIVYFTQSRYYDFGNIGFEMLYEYRKDLWSFIFFVVLIHAYRFIISRLQGEANPIQEGEALATNQVTPASIDRLIVKKLGKEFIINVESIEWMESSGNYVNLYIGDRVYPLRSTLTRLTQQLETKGFCRIHRSNAVKLDAIESITPLSSGDSEVKMHSGKVLTLSRRYKDNLKLMLN